MKRPYLITLLCCCLLQPAWPAGGGGGGGSSGSGGFRGASKDPDFAAGLRAVNEQDWQQVLLHMRKAVERDDNNADAWNYLGYAYRNIGDLPNSFKHYGKALQIDPKHLGAHEYVGEAYLQAGDLAGAETHLRILDNICWLSCEEYRDLKRKIKDYKARQATQQ